MTFVNLCVEKQATCAIVGNDIFLGSCQAQNDLFLRSKRIAGLKCENGSGVYIGILAYPIGERV